jgi:hypothetical protein
MFRIDAHPVETKVDSDLNNGGGPQRNPKAESRPSAMQFLLQTLTRALRLVHQILLKDLHTERGENARGARVPPRWSRRSCLRFWPQGFFHSSPCPMWGTLLSSVHCGLPQWTVHSM